MRTEKINYTCDDCGDHAVFKSYVKARQNGWGLARDGVTCYCPECAPAHRLGGANGKRPRVEQWLPKGCEQLKIEI